MPKHPPKLLTADNTYLIIALAMFYVSFKLVCNPIFFRQVNIEVPLINYSLNIVGSSFIYPFIYILSDVIVAVSTRKTGIIIALIGIACDGMFSFTVKHITTLNLPSHLTEMALANSRAINQVGAQMWQLYLHGVLAAIAVAVIEIILFAFLLKRLNNFFVSTLISVVVTLSCHNIITDYPMLKHQANAWSLIFNSLAINITIMFIYAALVAIILKLFKNR